MNVFVTVVLADNSERAHRLRFRGDPYWSVRRQCELEPGSAGPAQPETGDVAGLFVDAAGDLPRRLLRTASHLERAHIAIELARPVQQLVIIHDFADPASGRSVPRCVGRAILADVPVETGHHLRRGSAERHQHVLVGRVLRA